MIVKGQLTDAQLEIVADVAARDALDHKPARIVYVISNNKMYISNGSSWNSFADQSAVGDIKASMLTEAQYQSEFGPEWILADGRNVTGSDYHSITGIINIPDLRGVFLRGKNNGRSDGNQNPDGELTLGQFTDDRFQSHTHSYSDRYFRISSAFGDGTEMSNLGNYWYYTDTIQDRSTLPSGTSTETSPKSVTINYFIKINRDLGV